MSTIDKETLVFGMIESNSDKIAKINLVGKTVKDILVGEYTRHENCLETDSLFMLIFDDGNDISFRYVMRHWMSTSMLLTVLIWII